MTSFHQDLEYMLSLLMAQTRMIPDRERGGIIVILPTDIFLEIEDLLDIQTRRERHGRDTPEQDVVPGATQ